jgi:hypothetical protein
MNASENPILSPEFRPSEQLALPEATPALSQTAASIARWLGNTRAEVYGRARRLRLQYPLQVVGVLMGTAFVFGVAIRIWSSYKHDR